MKTLFFKFLIFLLTFVSCSKKIIDIENEFSKNNNVNNKHIEKVKIVKIDSTSHNYIYSIENSNLKAKFCSFKNCKRNKNKKNKIHLNTYYDLILVKYGSHLDVELETNIIIDNQLIWNSNSEYIYFDECLNICGMYFIENKK